MRLLRSRVALSTLPPLVAVAVAVGAAAACAGAAGSSDGPPIVLVPSQPPAAASSTSPTSAPTVTAPQPAFTLPFKCEGTSTQRFDIGGRAYCGYAEGETWEASERRCVANGGHLLSLETAAKSEDIRRELGSPLGPAVGRAAWIGLEKDKRVAGGKKWRWINGTEVTTTVANWNANEPNNFDGNEACGEWLAVDGRWNDTRCDLKQPYLCQESKADKPLACSKGRQLTVKGTRYCHQPVAKNFADAKKACETDGGTLAIFKSVEENTALKEAMAQRFAAKRMWIGATDSADEGTWTWVSGVAVDWQRWMPDEPNNFNREDCAELHADVWMWNDMDCGMKLPSICEGAAAKR